MVSALPRNNANVLLEQSTGAVHRVFHIRSLHIGTPAHIALAILNCIMHGVGIFVAYTSAELKGKKRQYCQCGKGPLTSNKCSHF